MRFGVIFIFFLMQTLASCGSPGEAETTDGKEVVCFVYHRFGDDRYPSTNVSLAHFESHLAYLRQEGFQVLTLSDAARYLRSDEPPRKTAVITIDDGYSSFYENGLPLLEKYKYPATLFINTETVGGKDYMGWNELGDARQRNIEIGNHTHSHDYFLNLPEDIRYNTFEEEIELSQKLIKENLGREPRVFAYPYGEFDPRMKEIVRSLGFEAAAAQNSGVVHSGSDLMSCPRFPMSEFYSDPEKFASKAEMHPVYMTDASPGSFVLPSGTPRPSLSLTFEADHLQLGQLQCFVQGSGCEVTLDQEAGKVTLKATTDISGRRRTLYTITLPDTSGGWHWYSHLWINPAVE